MATYIIRKGKPEDCEDIVELIKELAEYESMPDQVDMTEQKLRDGAFSSQPCVNLLVAVCGKTKEVVGYSSFSFMFSSWKGRTVYLDDVYVTPAHRGSGLGTTLMQAVARHAIDSGCTRMSFVVLNWNSRPRELYKRMGAENLTEKEGWHFMTFFQENLQRFVSEYKVEKAGNTTITVDL